jgi:hypothetical protein
MVHASLYCLADDAVSPGEWFLTFQTYVVPSSERIKKMSPTRWHSYLGMVSPARDWLGMWRANWGRVVTHSFRRSGTTRPMTWCHITKTVSPKKMPLEPQFPTIPYGTQVLPQLPTLSCWGHTTIQFWYSGIRCHHRWPTVLSQHIPGHQTRHYLMLAHNSYQITFWATIF